jgi:hypothetical protein
MKRVPQMNHKDAQLTRHAGDVKQAISELQDIPLTQGVLIEGIPLAQATATFVSHGLSSRVRGWVLVDTNRAIAGLRRLRSSEVKDTHLALYADTVTSGPATISVWVF